MGASIIHAKHNFHLSGYGRRDAGRVAGITRHNTHKKTMKTPKCTNANRHSWAPTGGCAENPGYVGIGGAAIRYSERCSFCGMERTKVIGDNINSCGNKNHGFRYSA